MHFTDQDPIVRSRCFAAWDPTLANLEIGPIEDNKRCSRPAYGAYVTIAQRQSTEQHLVFVTKFYLDVLTSLTISVTPTCIANVFPKTRDSSFQIVTLASSRWLRVPHSFIIG